MKLIAVPAGLALRHRLVRQFPFCYIGPLAVCASAFDQQRGEGWRILMRNHYLPSA
jgi:hypothetical protein